MLIKLEEISAAPLQLERSEAVSSFPELERLEEERQLAFHGPIVLHLQAYQVSGLVEVQGQLELLAKGTCSRCLAPAEMSIQSEFALTYISGPLSITDEDSEDEIELSAEEMSLIPFDGEEIDLTEEIQEQIIIALPVQPLCKEDCRGLCQRCGADLNHQSCHCEPEIFNSKFGALKKLKI